MYKWRVLLTLGSLILASSGALCDPPPRTTGVNDVDTDERVAAPVPYADLMLILTSDHGVAAVKFTDKIVEGRAYKFRYESKDGKERKAGQGKVFEKYKRIPGKNPDETLVKDDGGELFVKAGPIRLEWSLYDDDRGWVYYNPDKLRVQIATVNEFDKLDLKRFAK